MTATPQTPKSTTNRTAKSDADNSSAVSTERLLAQILESLDDLKGLDVRTINVTQISDVTDHMVLVSGTSNRHVSALVNRVTEDLKRSGVRPLGVEGRETSEWVLVDYGDVVVHVMQAEARGFYDLERLWSDLPDESDQ